MKKQPVTQLTIQTRSRTTAGLLEEERGQPEIKQEDSSDEWLDECGQRQLVEDMPSVEDSSTRSNTPENLTAEEEDTRGDQVEDQHLIEMAEARGPFITPNKFRGTPDENVEEYLAQFERF